MKIPWTYNLRSLKVRRVTTGMTILAIGLVVAVFVSLLALAEGHERTFSSTGLEGNAVILGQGALAEAMSFIPRDEVKIIRTLASIAREESGETLASAELLIQVFVPRRTGTLAMVLFRGVTPVSYEVHREVRLVEGRWPRPGTEELVVGSTASKRLDGVELGQDLPMGKSRWKIVGRFDAGGATYDSEVWCPLEALRADTRRDQISVVHLRLKPDVQVSQLRAQAEGDPRLHLTVRSEKVHFEEQSRQVWILRSMALFIASLMAIGAGFAAMNTMYGTIAYRSREIATLRAIGFTPRSILASFILESTFMAIPGGVIGCCLPFPFVHGKTGGTMNIHNLAEIAFEIRITPSILLLAMGFAVLIGIVGGYLPARAASRLSIVESLREA